MNSMGLKESDAESDRSSNGHIRDKESDAFTKRILEVVGDEPIHSFARRCGVGESTLRNIIKSGAWPRTDNLVAIADTANVNIEWLAAGRGPKMRGASTQRNAIYADKVPPQEHRDAPPLASDNLPISFDDLARLQMAIETVQEALTAANKQLPSDKLAQVIAISYKLLENMDQRDSVASLIKMAA